MRSIPYSMRCARRYAICLCNLYLHGELRGQLEFVVVGFLCFASISYTFIYLYFATRCEDGRACREWIISCVTTSSVCTHHSKWKSVVECISKKMNKTARGRWCAGRSGSACVVVDGICGDTLDSTCLQWTQLDEICVTCRLASLSCPRERLRPTRYPRR